MLLLYILYTQKVGKVEKKRLEDSRLNQVVCFKTGRLQSTDVWLR